jgi:hypothetical protein
MEPANALIAAPREEEEGKDATALHGRGRSDTFLGRSRKRHSHSHLMDQSCEKSTLLVPSALALRLRPVR